jgi:hypothetical protein
MKLYPCISRGLISQPTTGLTPNIQEDGEEILFPVQFQIYSEHDVFESSGDANRDSHIETLWN